jgi:hypothetical protein
VYEVCQIANGAKLNWNEISRHGQIQEKNSWDGYWVDHIEIYKPKKLFSIFSSFVLEFRYGDYTVES